MKRWSAEQEEIMEAVKSGQCREALKNLNKNQIKSFPSSYLSMLIFELIPQDTRSSKELADMLLQYGKIKWDQKNREGRYLHAVMIRFDRVDIAVDAVRGISHRDARNPEMTPIWTGVLCWLLDKYQRTAAAAMIRKGVMKEMDEGELERVTKKILAYHDISLFDAAHKYLTSLSPEILHMPKSLSERQFMREVLNGYQNVIEPDEKTDMKKLWEISIQCSAEHMVTHLLKKTGDFQYLPQIAAGSDEMFEVLLNVRCRKILDEVKKEVLFGALSCEQWRQRFDMLVHRGWKKSSQNKKEEIPLAAEYISRIETKRYSSDRKGHLEQINDRARVRFLVSYEQAKKVNVKG